MARKIQTPNGQGAKPIPKDKPKKSFSFFGLLKNTKPSDLVEEMKEDTTEEETTKPISKPILKRKQSEPIVKEVQEEIEPRPHITYQESEVYNKQEIEQTVFLYANSSIFAQVQKFYNSTFENINVVGTSALDRLEEVFIDRASSKFIMLFALDHGEIAYLRKFINSLHLEEIQPNVITILLITDPTEVKFDDIITREHHRKFVQHADITGDMTRSTLEKLMTAVVKQQPPYTPEKPEPIKPTAKVARTKVSVGKLTPKDIASLKEDIGRLKKSYESDESNQKRELMRTILTHQDVKDTIVSIENLPHLRVIKALEEEIGETLELMQDNPRMRDQVEDIIASKLILSSLRTSEMELILNEIMDNSISRMESVDSNLRDYNVSAVMEMKQHSDADYETLLAKREEIKADITKRFGRYKGLIQLISNSAQASVQAFQDTKKEISQLLLEHEDKISEDIITVTTNQLQIMDTKRDSYMNQVKISHDKMVEALDVTNKLLESYKILVSLDDIVINGLVQENEVLRQMQTVKVKVDSIFRANGFNLVALPGSGIISILDTFLKPSDLVVYYQDGNDGLIDELNQKLVEVNLKDFLMTDWERPIESHYLNLSWEKTITNPMQLDSFEEYDIQQPTVINRIISKLDYISQAYSNVYVIYRPTALEDIKSNKMLKAIGEHLSHVTIFSTLDNTSSVMSSVVLDELDELMSYRIFLNKVKKGSEEKYEEYKAVLNKKVSTVIIPYISDFDQGVKNNKKIKDSLASLKSRLK